MFVVSLYCGWIKARQAARADADATVRWLLERMENDPYGFASSLERDAVTVMHKDSLAAFERQVKARFEATAASGQTSESGPRRNHASRGGRWADVLREIYTQRRDVRAYVALCERSELSARDCLVVATMLKAKRKPIEALAWVDRGLALETQHPHGSIARYDLAKLKRELLTKLGRRDEALEGAWAEFREHPSPFSYRELMRFVPKAERAAWHAKTLDAAERADLGSLIELWLETREIERLARRLGTATDAEIEDLSHYRTDLDGGLGELARIVPPDHRPLDDPSDSWREVGDPGGASYANLQVAFQVVAQPSIYGCRSGRRHATESDD